MDLLFSKTIIVNEENFAWCSTDYKGVPKLAPQFTKTPLSVITSKGETACFCARIQCGKPMEIEWTINGKDARENSRCKVRRNYHLNLIQSNELHN